MHTSFLVHFLQKRLGRAAKKAITKLPSRTLRDGDEVGITYLSIEVVRRQGLSCITYNTSVICNRFRTGSIPHSHIIHVKLNPGYCCHHTTKYRNVSWIEIGNYGNVWINFITTVKMADV